MVFVRCVRGYGGVRGVYFWGEEFMEEVFRF